ncbi:MAG: hypothetical protein Q7R95_03765 [bacterium]|nr:hypothetical protein [bacterium]
MGQCKIEYLFLADAANIDNFGKLNVLGIFQNIFLNKVPGSILKFVLISSIFVKDPNKPFQIEIKIKDKKDNYIKLQPQLIFPFKPEVGNKDKVINLMIDLINVKFDSFGTYEIEVFADSNKIGSKFLEIVEKKN